ncbi:MAG: 50S ribosomal protein L35 [bacterium]
MPKMKTHKGAAKRFKRTSGGKLIHKKAGMSHLLSGKSRKRKRRLNLKAGITGTHLKKAKQLLPE